MTNTTHIEGSLYGLIYGDILGCPVETWTQEEISLVYGIYNTLPKRYPFTISEKRKGRLRPLGLYSDDGQQAMALLLICMQPNGFVLNNWKTMLTEGMKKKIWRGYGKFFAQAVTRMTQGVIPQKAGSPSAGIGSAMRIGPLGAFYREDLKQLQKVVIESTASTHGDIRAIAIAYAVAYAVFAFINGQTATDVRQGLPQAVKAVEKQVVENYKKWNIDTTHAHDVSHMLSRMCDKPVVNLDEMRRELKEEASRYLRRSHVHPNDGFALLGGIHAVMCSLHETEHPHDVLVSIVQLGDDTDTVAAIAGSILGARYGKEWIPTEDIRSKNRVDSYAKELFTKQAPETLQQFWGEERLLTIEEKNYQA